MLLLSLHLLSNRLWLGLLDVALACTDRLLRVAAGVVSSLFRFKDDEAELATTTANAIKRQLDTLHSAILGEVLANVILRHVAVDATDEDLLADRPRLGSLGVDHFVADLVGPVVQHLHSNARP